MGASTGMEEFKMDGFEVEEVLDASPWRKWIALQGRVPGKEGRAVVLLEKKPFDAEEVERMFRPDAGVECKLDFQNAEYCVYNMQVSPSLNTIKCDTIFPATEQQVNKYRRDEVHVVWETPEVYKHVVLPFVEENERGRRIQWVHNILDGVAEQERIIYQNNDPRDGFVLLPDSKWDQSNVSNLYCLAIVNRRDLLCLRSLNDENLDLLQNIHNQGCSVLLDKYGVTADKLIVHIHYLPTFWHLHVHFLHVDLALSAGVTSKAHNLRDCIENIRLLPNYYQVKPMEIRLLERSLLWKAWSEAEVAGAVTQLSIE
eukprot:768030-Hanusia_phi.AAC.2